jgi:hypothetical protein
MRASQPIWAMSIGIWPSDCVASTTNGTPNRRASAPTAATGSTRPECVGMWQTATSAAGPAASVASSSSRSIVPMGVEPTTSTTMPASRRSASSMSALDTYSLRVTTTRSPRLRPRAPTIVCHARVALSTSATSSGCAPVMAATAS